MKRVLVICEGQTEETFVNEVLREPLLEHNLLLVPILIGRPGKRGGYVTFDRLFKDVKISLQSDRTALCTTFFDFYGLDSEFPGKADALEERSLPDKAAQITSRLAAQVREVVGHEASGRFIPYVQMYEFEGLLFSNPEAFAKALGQPDLSKSFRGIRDAFDSPEHINNDALTAPSKRVVGLYPKYDKPVGGSVAALSIGLQVIERECPLFRKWLEDLRAHGGPS